MTKLTYCKKQQKIWLRGSNLVFKDFVTVVIEALQFVHICWLGCFVSKSIIISLRNFTSSFYFERSLCFRYRQIVDTIQWVGNYFNFLRILRIKKKTCWVIYTCWWLTINSHSVNTCASLNICTLYILSYVNLNKL